jgi:hypothetical protein
VVTPLDEDRNKLPPVGRVAKPFVYSCKVLLSIKDYAKKTMDEFRRRVNKALKNAGEWVKRNRPPNVIYRNNMLSILPNVGKVTTNKLAQLGIDTVADLQTLPANQLKAIKNLPSKEGGGGCQTFNDSTTSAKPPLTEIAHLARTTKRKTIRTWQDMGTNNGNKSSKRVPT